MDTLEIIREFRDEFKKGHENKKSEYKSAKRSRQFIRDAYTTLLQNKPSEKISISDIVLKAGITRSTFYAHYKAPEEVLKEIAEELIIEIDKLLDGFSFINFVKAPLPILEKFCDYLDKNQETHKKLLTLHTTEIFIRKLHDLIAVYVLEDKTLPEALTTNKNYYIALDFFINGLIYSFRNAIDNPDKVNKKDVAKVVSFFIAQNYQLLLNYK